MHNNHNLIFMAHSDHTINFLLLFWNNVTAVKRTEQNKSDTYDFLLLKGNNVRMRDARKSSVFVCARKLK